MGKDGKRVVPQRLRLSVCGVEIKGFDNDSDGIEGLGDIDQAVRALRGAIGKCASNPPDDSGRGL